jgi:flagellar L-ring protein precursor FlgH
LAQAAGGSIYSADRNIALFENAVARNVGDIVTIRLVERTAASKSASTTTSKATSASLPGPTIAGRPVTVTGTPVLETSVENEATFDGAGASNQSNRLDGNVTVTVVRRLPNGNLLVRGEKWLTLNQGREVVRLQGVIRPIDIEPDNTIPSSKVANAVISYAGRGPIANANAPGLLARFFNSPWLPF